MKSSQHTNKRACLFHCIRHSTLQRFNELKSLLQKCSSRFCCSGAMFFQSFYCVWS